MRSPGRTCPAIHSASRLARVPLLQRCPKHSSQPNKRAMPVTHSFSMAELARPPSRAWLLGLIHMLSA